MKTIMKCTFTSEHFWNTSGCHKIIFKCCGIRFARNVGYFFDPPIANQIIYYVSIKCQFNTVLAPIKPLKYYCQALVQTFRQEIESKICCTDINWLGERG